MHDKDGRMIVVLVVIAAALLLVGCLGFAIGVRVGYQHLGDDCMRITEPDSVK